MGRKLETAMQEKARTIKELNKTLKKLIASIFCCSSVLEISQVKSNTQKRQQ